MLIRKSGFLFGRMLAEYLKMCSLQLFDNWHRLFKSMFDIKERKGERDWPCCHIKYDWAGGGGIKAEKALG